MPTYSTNYGLTIPLVDSSVDEDLYGTQINGDLTNLDSLMLSAINFVKSSKTASFNVTAPTSGSATIGDAKKLFLCNATSGAITATLPLAAAAGDGFTIAVKKTDSSSNAIAFAVSGSDTIDGTSSLSLTRQYDWIVLISDGSASWNIVSKNQQSSAPTITVYSSGSGTYTTPANTKSLHIRMVGGGAGGGGSGSSTSSGVAGGNTTFGSLAANGGGSTGSQTGGDAGTATGGTLNAYGGYGHNGLTGPSTNLMGGSGGTSMFGGGGRGGSASAGVAAGAYGAGGGGGATGAISAYCAGGGGAGGYLEYWTASPSATYSYSVGAGGAGGAAGTNGYAGGAGAGGIIIVEAYE